MHHYCVSVLGNILWFILGGVLVALLYFIGGLIICLTIIGIPFGVQLMKLGWFSMAPFGVDVVHGEKATGCVAVGLNVLWILVGGFWLAVVHLVFAALCGITIILLPFAKQHLKLMAISFAPFGVQLRESNRHPEPAASGAARLQ